MKKKMDIARFEKLNKKVKAMAKNKITKDQAVNMAKTIENEKLKKGRER